MLNTTQAFRKIIGDLNRALTTTADKPEVKRETKFYLDNIGKIKTADAFVKNDRLFRYAMKAFGMDDMAYAKAMVRKALLEGVEDKNAFANKLVDTRLKEFVSVFNFARHGEYTTTFADTKQGTVDKYVRQTLEITAGEQNEGVRLALYFERKASTITDAYSILADKNLLRIVQTAFDIPATSSAQDIDKQASLIESKLNISDLANPSKLKSFLNRFTVKWELSNLSGKPVANLFLPSTSGVSVQSLSSDVMMAIQTLKLRN